MNKQMHVAFVTQKLKEQFQYLKEGKFENQQLYKFIDRALDDLKQNPLCGTRKITTIIFLCRNEVVSSFLV